MPLEAAFNVLNPDENVVVYTQTATALNSGPNYTMVDHRKLNGNPHTLMYVTHNWNPGGGLGGVYNDQALGVHYSEFYARWSIINQHAPADMPLGTVYNVLIVPNIKIFLPLIQRQH